MNLLTDESSLEEIDGLASLWEETLGDPEICIAVLDGPVDNSHPCFKGARLRHLPTIAPGAVGSGAMSAHGTHVASVIFGQPGSPVHGIAPRCQGLIVPVFRDGQGRLSQLDLARAVEQAVQHGAQVINISGGQRSSTDEADDLLARAIRLCEENRVLIVSAAGNDGCECLHVPAAVGSVLAVGAMDKSRRPLKISNWGEEYQRNGVLAPGENILGAVPGGGTTLRTGTSFAAPIVAGAVGLLLSVQLRDGKNPDARTVGDAILASALPCDPKITSDQRRCLAGILNVPGAYALIAEAKGEEMTNSQAGVEPLAPVGIPPQATAEGVEETRMPPPNRQPVRPPRPVIPQLEVSTPNATDEMLPSGIGSLAGCSCSGRSRSYVFGIGTIGYDFGTEARRDPFRQLMPVHHDRPANPYDTEQMIRYLEHNPSKSTNLIWTFNLELTPIYAIEADGPYAREVYDFLRKALSGQIQNEGSADYISRVSLPGILWDRTVQLFSGQVVPVVMTQYRGLWSWNVNTLVDAVISRFDHERHESIRRVLKNFLDKVYYELRILARPRQTALSIIARQTPFKPARQCPARSILSKVYLARVFICSTISSFRKVLSAAWIRTAGMSSFGSSTQRTNAAPGRLCNSQWMSATSCQLLWVQFVIGLNQHVHRDTPRSEPLSAE